jgi:hypothetical protein
VRIQYGDFQERRVGNKGDDIVGKENGAWIRGLMWCGEARLKKPQTATGGT